MRKTKGTTGAKGTNRIQKSRKPATSVRNGKSVRSSGRKKSRKPGRPGRKRRGGLRIRDRRIALITAVVVMAAAAVFLFCISYVVLGSYNGLGKKDTIRMNRYSSDALYTENGLRHYRDKNYRSIPGIDVSVFQGNVDWDKVYGAGIRFAMIRVGYSGSEKGTIHEDENFRKNLKGAKKAGLDVGVYFYSQAITTDEAVREAKYVVRHIRGRGITYPVVYDMEHTPGDRVGELTKKEKTEIADAFCTIVQKNSFRPMIYGNPEWLLKNLDLRYLTGYEFWLAHYSKTSYYPYQYAMWQYSSTGKIKGIRKNVDLNIYFVKK